MRDRREETVTPEEASEGAAAHIVVKWDHPPSPDWKPGSSHPESRPRSLCLHEETRRLTECLQNPKINSHVNVQSAGSTQTSKSRCAVRLELTRLPLECWCYQAEMGVYLQWSTHGTGNRYKRPTSSEPLLVHGVDSGSFEYVPRRWLSDRTKGFLHCCAPCK